MFQIQISSRIWLVMSLFFLKKKKKYVRGCVLCLLLYTCKFNQNDAPKWLQPFNDQCILMIHKIRCVILNFLINGHVICTCYLQSFVSKDCLEEILFSLNFNDERST